MEEKRVFMIRRLRKGNAMKIAKLLKKEGIHCSIDLIIEPKKEKV